MTDNSKLNTTAATAAMKDTANWLKSEDQLSLVQAHLPSDLHEFLFLHERMGVAFHHPFQISFGLRALLPDVVQPDYPPENLVTGIPGNIERRQKIFDDLCAERDWVAALYVVERPYRYEYLNMLMENYGVEPLLAAVGFVWCDAHSIAQDEDGIWGEIWDRVLFTKARTSRKRRFYVMDAEERAAFAELPEDLTVYRGFQTEGGEESWSWSLDREMAVWFARRFASSTTTARLATMKVRKADVLAYFTGRKESEIVLHATYTDFTEASVELLPLEMEDAA